MSSSSNGSSPSFSALTAAAFALSHSPIEQSSPSHPENPQNQQQRYTTFHGAVYKSVPGCIPTTLSNSSNHYRGNTAAAINAKRIAAAHSQIINSNGNFVTNTITTPLPPNQPQNIPSYQQYLRSDNVNEGIPLDVLASAVSNFRPNGYNYFMRPPTPTSQGQQWYPHQLPNSNSTAVNAAQAQMINRNRLAPLRTASPLSDSPDLTKLPSLKALAQVASIGMIELDQHSPQLQRSKSFSIEADATELSKLMTSTRRFSSVEVSNNAVAPNSSTSTRRPW